MCVNIVEQITLPSPRIAQIKVEKVQSKLSLFILVILVSNQQFPRSDLLRLLLEGCHLFSDFPARINLTKMEHENDCFWI